MNGEVNCKKSETNPYHTMIRVVTTSGEHEFITYNPLLTEDEFDLNAIKNYLAKSVNMEHFCKLYHEYFNYVREFGFLVMRVFRTATAVRVYGELNDSTNPSLTAILKETYDFVKNLQVFGIGIESMKDISSCFRFGHSFKIKISEEERCIHFRQSNSSLKIYFKDSDECVESDTKDVDIIRKIYNLVDNTKHDGAFNHRIIVDVSTSIVDEMPALSNLIVHTALPKLTVHGIEMTLHHHLTVGIISSHLLTTMDIHHLKRQCIGRRENIITERLRSLCGLEFTIVSLLNEIFIKYLHYDWSKDSSSVLSGCYVSFLDLGLLQMSSNYSRLFEAFTSCCSYYTHTSRTNVLLKQAFSTSGFRMSQHDVVNTECEVAYSHIVYSKLFTQEGLAVELSLSLPQDTIMGENKFCL